MHLKAFEGERKRDESWDGKCSISSLCFLCRISHWAVLFSESPVIMSTDPHAVGYRRLFLHLFLNDHLNDSKEVGIAFLGRPYCASSCFPK